MAVRVQLVTGGPLLLGLVAGFLLGETAAGYWVVTAIATIGGVLAGTEHQTTRDGALRGLAGGFLFGLGIWLAHVISADPEVVHLPSPALLIVLITTIAGVGLGALGGWLRSRQTATPS